MKSFITILSFAILQFIFTAAHPMRNSHVGNYHVNHINHIDSNQIGNSHIGTTTGTLHPSEVMIEFDDGIIPLSVVLGTRRDRTATTQRIQITSVSEGTVSISGAQYAVAQDEERVKCKLFLRNSSKYRIVEFGVPFDNGKLHRITGAECFLETMGHSFQQQIELR